MTVRETRLRVRYCETDAQGVVNNGVYLALNVVLPAISEDFGVSEARVGWVVTSFFLVMAVGIPLFGRVSDFFDLKRLFTLALLTYAAGSLICALSPNLLVLVSGRIVQAAGNAAILPLATVAVVKTLPSGWRGGALGSSPSAWAPEWPRGRSWAAWSGSSPAARKHRCGWSTASPRARGRWSPRTSPLEDRRLKVCFCKADSVYT